MISKTQDIRTPCNTDVYIFINNNTDIIYCLISLFAESFAENVINKAFNKHAVVSFTGTWIETCHLIEDYNEATSYPLRVRGLKHDNKRQLIIMTGRILYGYVD